MNLDSQNFEIKILRQHWVKDDGKDDCNDLCSHGELYLKIGSKELSTKELGSWTLTSTALYLMRSVMKSYKVGDYSSQLIPCCGHLYIAGEDEKSVDILGCPNGIDWTIEHISDEEVRHTTLCGERAVVPLELYRKLVLGFVQEVEAFYYQGAPKELPKDEFDRKGYELFWREWQNLKNGLTQEDGV